MRRNSQRESRKPKTAADKGKRYRCCVCRKRAPRKTTAVPYYCHQHIHLRGRNDNASAADARWNPAVDEPSG